MTLPGHSHYWSPTTSHHYIDEVNCQFQKVYIIFVSITEKKIYAHNSKNLLREPLLEPFRTVIVRSKVCGVPPVLVTSTCSH